MKNFQDVNIVCEITLSIKNNEVGFLAKKNSKVKLIIIFLIIKAWKTCQDKQPKKQSMQHGACEHFILIPTLELLHTPLSLICGVKLPHIHFFLIHGARECILEFFFLLHSFHYQHFVVHLLTLKKNLMVCQINI